MKQQQQTAIAAAQEPDLYCCPEEKRKPCGDGADSVDSVEDTDGYDQKDCRLYDHIRSIPGKCDQPVQRPQMHQCQQKFTDQHAAEIGIDPEAGDADQHEANAKHQCCGILKKGRAGAAKAVQDAAHGGGKVEKRAEPRKNLNKISGVLVVEYADSQCFSEQGKDADTEDSHVQAVTQGHGNTGGDLLFLACRLGPRNAGKQKDGHGIGDGRRKENKRGKRYNRDKVRKTDVNAVIYRVFLILSLFLYQYVLFLI